MVTASFGMAVEISLCTEVEIMPFLLLMHNSDTTITFGNHSFLSIDDYDYLIY